MDHIFLDVGLTSTDKDGEITAIAAVRTNAKGIPIASFSSEVTAETFGDVVDDLLSSLLASREPYVVVAAHAETDRQFLKDAWRRIDSRWKKKGHRNEIFDGIRRIDILQLAWPLCYNEGIGTSFEDLVNHFDVTYRAAGTTQGDCEALVRTYWKLMSRYKVALYTDGLVRNIGGKGYQAIVSIFK